MIIYLLLAKGNFFLSSHTILFVSTYCTGTRTVRVVVVILACLSCYLSFRQLNNFPVTNVNTLLYIYEGTFVFHNALYNKIPSYMVNISHGYSLSSKYSGSGLNLPAQF